MKTTVIAKYRYRIAAGLLLLLGPACYGFRADEDAKLEKQAAPPEPRAAATREVSVEQRRAAQLGAADGLQVEWHPRLGTPVSVRGPGLG